MSNTRKTSGDVLNLDAVLEKEASKEPFPFVLDGQSHELPHARTLTSRQAQRMEVDLEEVLLELLDKSVVDRLLDLPVGVLERLSKDWVRHAGLAPGESGASRT